MSLPAVVINYSCSVHTVKLLLPPSDSHVNICLGSTLTCSLVVHLLFSSGGAQLFYQWVMTTTRNAGGSWWQSCFSNSLTTFYDINPTFLILKKISQYAQYHFRCLSVLLNTHWTTMMILSMCFGVHPHSEASRSGDSQCIPGASIFCSSLVTRSILNILIPPTAKLFGWTAGHHPECVCMQHACHMYWTRLTRSLIKRSQEDISAACSDAPHRWDKSLISTWYPIQLTCLFKSKADLIDEQGDTVTVAAQRALHATCHLLPFVLRVG